MISILDTTTKVPCLYHLLSYKSWRASGSMVTNSFWHITCIVCPACFNFQDGYLFSNQIPLALYSYWFGWFRKRVTVLMLFQFVADFKIVSWSNNPFQCAGRVEIGFSQLGGISYLKYNGVRYDTDFNRCCAEFISRNLNMHFLSFLRAERMKVVEIIT